MAENIFRGGKKELFELKEILEKYHEHKSKLQELLDKQEQQQEYNNSRAAEIAGEVALKEAEMRANVIKEYEKEAAVCKEETDKILADKEEKRKEAISFYVNEELKRIAKEGDYYSEEIRQLLKNAGLPEICKSKLFFALFYPQTWSDAILLVICLLLVFLALPFGMFYLCCPNGGRLELTTIYLCVVIIFFAVYILINNMVKENHIDTIKKIHEYRMQVTQTEKMAGEITEKVSKRSDEELLCEFFSQEYIEEVSQKIENLNRRLKEISARCDAALKEFDENVSAKAEREELFMKDYRREIRKREEVLEALQKLIDEENRSLETIDSSLDKFKPLQKEIDIHSRKVADELLGYLRNHAAKNIEEAIECMKRA